MMKRTIGVVTVARSDYGIYTSLLRAIRNDSELDLALFVGGMHLSPEFGLTVREIEHDGFPIIERVESLISSDTPEGLAKSMGLGTLGFAQAFARSRPDILVVLGDRFEMHAAALAALPFKIPVAHLHGGEITSGAIDDALRHSITKLSHLHFVSTDVYAWRVMQLGEEPWRIVICGAPSLDQLSKVDLLSKDVLAEKYQIPAQSAPILVTFHPVTLEYEKTEYYVTELLAALEEISIPIIFTLPNADTGGRIIRDRLQFYAYNHPNTRIIENMGSLGYFSVMAWVVAMVGNSSSGIIEAPSFGLPVVNIGTRQEGRVRGSNVIDVGYSRQEILAGVRQALSLDFRESIVGKPNPYGSGEASTLIVQRLKSVSLDAKLIKKKFYDLPFVYEREA